MAVLTRVSSLCPFSAAEGIGGDGQQDDQALDGFFPLGLGAEEDECRSDRAEQSDADQATRECAPAAGDRHASHNDGGDDLELQPLAGVGVDIARSERH